MKAWWFQNKSKTGRFFLTAGLIFLFLVIIALGGYFYYRYQNNLKADHSKESATRFTHLALAELDQNKLPFQENFSIKPVDWVDVQLENKITVNNSGEKLALTPVGADLSRREFVSENQTEVIYREVYPGVDFKYSAAKDHLKEDIIVKDQQSAGQFSFSFVLDDDLQLIHESDGGYLVKKGESYLYYFYPFTAVDAAGKKIDYQTSIVGEENNTFVIVAKPKKLADLQAATYPVVIDPTITWTFPLSSPTLSIISPSNSPTAGGREITLTGTNFFGYKQTINVAYSGSVLTNFVGKFYLETADLIANGQMRDDCGDLRVYQGNTKLSYQLVAGCGGTAQVNVLIPSISGSTSLELYYGDADLTSESTDIGPLTSFTATDSLVYFAATLNGSETPTYQTITTRNASIPVEFYKFYGDRTISGTTYLGAGAADANMLMARYEGNLTIDSGAIFTPNARKRGMVLYVDGNLTINGRISMNGRGAFGVAGQDILIF
ncbi:MAG TPA: IPT/TIG domain-containing protein, partial [bacterium]|nr:IPT/TIG domain-containing protein [bacterium]